MTIPKQYFRDHLVLLLLSVNSFLTVAGTLFILIRLSTSHGNGYIVQYRPTVAFETFKQGNISDLLSMIVFLWLVFAVHTLLSLRIYHIHRQLTVAILSLGMLLLVLTVIITNALLMLR
jgi:hypothetical protein